MAFTKVTGPGIHTLSNIISHNIDSSGIITATKFVGTFEGSATGDIVTNDWITHKGDTNTRIGFPDTDIFSVETSGTSRIYVESGGDVGIGTVNPHKRLHVADYGTHGAIRIEGSGNGNRSGIEFYRETSAGVSKGGAAIWVESDTSSSAGKLRFGTASNAAIQSQNTDMILDNSGQLGIGTDNPTDTLHVGKLNSNHGIKLERYGATNPGSSTLQVQSNGALSVTSTNHITLIPTSNVGLGTVTPQQKLDVRGNTIFGIDQVSGNPGTAVGITTIRGHHVNSDADYAQLYLSNSKSAGGGSPSTASIRAGRETNNYGTNLSFWTNGTGSAGDGVEKLRITGIGSVGINNTSPATIVDIKSAKASDGVTITKGSNVAAFLGHNGTGDEGLLHLKDGGTATIQIYGESGQVSFFNAGNVGIGTQNPAGKLEIDAASTTDMIMLDVAGTNFAKIGHNSSGGVAVLDVRSEGHTRFLTGGNNERLRISNSGYMQMKNSAGSTFALLRNNAVADSSTLLGAVDFGTIDWDSSTAAIKSYQDGAKDNASLRFYTQAAVGPGIQERLRINSDGRIIPAISGGTGGIGLVGAFMARPSAAYSKNSGTEKVSLGTEEFDANGWFNTGNSRYTPLCKGWYQFNFFYQIRTNINGSAVELFLYPYKNGAVANGGPVHGWDDNYGNYAFITFSTMIYCNGTTDYIEMYGNSSRSTEVSVNSRMSGFLVHPVA